MSRNPMSGTADPPFRFGLDPKARPGTSESRTPDVVMPPEVVRMLPAFSGKNPTCRKCEHQHTVGTINKYDPATDTMLRTCASCSFTWSERSADHSGGAIK